MCRVREAWEASEVYRRQDAAKPQKTHVTPPRDLQPRPEQQRVDTAAYYSSLGVPGAGNAVSRQLFEGTQAAGALPSQPASLLPASQTLLPVTSSAQVVETQPKSPRAQPLAVAPHITAEVVLSKALSQWELFCAGCRKGRYTNMALQDFYLNSTGPDGKEVPFFCQYVNRKCGGTCDVCAGQTGDACECGDAGRITARSGEVDLGPASGGGRLKHKGHRGRFRKSRFMAPCRPPSRDGGLGTALHALKIVLA